MENFSSAVQPVRRARKAAGKKAAEEPGNGEPQQVSPPQQASPPQQPGDDEPQRVSPPRQEPESTEVSTLHWSL